MTDQLIPKRGSLPWKPSTGAVLVDVFDRYDRPLIGLIRDDGNEYLFACIAGQADDWNAWVYTQVDPNERKLLEETDDFESALAKVARGKASVLAIANEDGIVDATFVEHAEELPGTLATLLEWVGRRTLRKGAAQKWISSGVDVSPSPSAFHRSGLALTAALTEAQNRWVVLTSKWNENENLDYESNKAAAR